MPKLLDKYRETPQNAATLSLNTLHHWSKEYGWIKRGEQYDIEIESQKNKRRQQIMENGFALDYERTDELKKLAHFLVEQLYEKGEDGTYHNLWVPDVKQIGRGDFAERVDIERFNAAIISELRGVLDDIAKETGGRKIKQDVEQSGEVRLKIVYEDGTDDKAKETTPETS